MEPEAPCSERLIDRTAIVTGGGGSIGAGISVRLAREGANVVIAQRSRDSATEVVERIEELGGDAMYVPTDLTVEADVDSVVERTIDRFGGIDVVVNNAANPKKEWADAMDRETWDDIVATNLTGSFLLAQRAYPTMQEQDYGRIVNIGAIQSYSPLPGSAAYAASKAGLEGLTRSLATEWSANGVTVNTIHVGPVYGSDWTDSPPGTDAPVEQRYETVPDADDDGAATLVKRLGRPSDVAALVAFLSAPESGFLTGTVIPCDGGRLISRAPEPFDQEESI